MKIRIDDEYSNLGDGLNIVLDEYLQEEEVKQLDSKFGENGNYYEATSENEFNVEIQYLEEGVARSKYDNKKNNISKGTIKYNNISGNIDNYSNGNTIDYNESNRINESTIDYNEINRINDSTIDYNEINRVNGNTIDYNEINSINENTINYDNINNVNKNSIDYNNSDEDNYTNNINEKYKEYDKFCYDQEINYNYEDEVNYDEPVDYSYESKINYSESSNFNSEEKIDESKYSSSNFDEQLNYSNDLELINEENECFEKTSDEEWEDNNKKSIRIDDLNIYNEEEKISKSEDIFSNSEYMSNDNEDIYNSNEESIFSNNESIFNNNEERVFSNNEVEAKNDYFNSYNPLSSEYSNFEDNYGDKYEEICEITKGEIRVSVRLGDRNGIEIKGAKINLYELNGVCPRLYESKLTDRNGEVIFDNLENGCYRVISLVDRRFFEKPIYITWNEVTIDNYLKEANISVVNRVKPSCLKR